MRAQSEQGRGQARGAAGSQAPGDDVAKPEDSWVLSWDLGDKGRMVQLLVFIPSTWHTDFRAAIPPVPQFPHALDSSTVW